MAAGKIIAVVSDYAGLIEALRERSVALGLRREDVDAIAKLPDGFAGKTLVPIPRRRADGKRPTWRGLIAGTLGPMLRVHGCRLALVDDHDSVRWVLAELRKQPTAKKRINADGRMPTRKRRAKGHFPGNSEFWRTMRARATLKMTPAQRRASARHAARARWSNSKREQARRAKARRQAQASGVESVFPPNS